MKNAPQTLVLAVVAVFLTNVGLTRADRLQRSPFPSCVKDSLVLVVPQQKIVGISRVAQNRCSEERLPSGMVVRRRQSGRRERVETLVNQSFCGDALSLVGEDSEQRQRRWM